MRKRFQGVLLVAISVFLLYGTSRAQEVAAEARVDSTDYLIGDWITVHIEITHPQAAAIRGLAADSLHPFQVINRLLLDRKSETTTTTGLVVAMFDSGTAILPPVSVLYSLPDDTTLLRAQTNQLILKVHRIPVDTAQAIKDVKPPLSISLTFAEIALIVGGVLLIAGLVFLLYRYWKKKQQKKTGEVYVPPPRPAHVVALEELAILKERKLWQQGFIKQYYSEVTEILRRYFENRYGIMALEQTTDEIMDDLRKQIYASEVLKENEVVLRRADLVKFAKFQPGIPEHQEMLNVAYDIVDKTRVVETKPLVSRAQVPENVGA
jgi:hypothetical protein